MILGAAVILVIWHRPRLTDRATPAPPDDPAANDWTDEPIFSSTAPTASAGTQTLFTVTWPWSRMFVITHVTLSPYVTANECELVCEPPLPESHSIDEP